MIGTATRPRRLELKLRTNDVQLVRLRPMKIRASVIPFWNDDTYAAAHPAANGRASGLQSIAFGG
jgi:hypothetical protein